MTVQNIYSSALAAHNGRITEDDARFMITEAERENSASASGFCCCSSDGSLGTVDLRDVFLDHRDAFSDSARGLIQSWLRKHRVASGDLTAVNEETGPADLVGKTLVDKKAKHSTWHCNWFPMARRLDAPGANLYSAGGPCQKYDAVTGRKSTAHEEANHTGGGVSWAGHCDMAARVCSLLAQPLRDVEYNGQIFTVNDIQGLLVMVSNDLAADNEPFWGYRNNGAGNDDPSEPYPHTLMPKIIEWAEEGKCFVLDIDPSTAVWNYAFDSAKIKEFDTPQEGLPRMPATRGGKVRYQNWELHGTGYDQQTRRYRSWIEYDSEGKKLASGWYRTSSDGKNNPDFAWLPVARGDLSRKENWPTSCSYNPEIDPRVVFDIYTRSI